MHNWNLKLSVLFVDLSASCTNLFIHCYLGNQATFNCHSYGDLLYESNWIALSPLHRKYIFVMIANAQRPIHYHGFGIAYLNMELFTKVNGQQKLLSVMKLLDVLSIVLTEYIFHVPTNLLL